MGRFRGVDGGPGVTAAAGGSRETPPPEASHRGAGYALAGALPEGTMSGPPSRGQSAMQEFAVIRATLRR